jgi:hypothetical protein
MSNWKPWHQVVELRDDLKSGELSLNIFAVDLYDVLMGVAKEIYQKPEEFFALTYPTYALRELARDVILRLAGLSEKAIRQLDLTYGGGKTHTLITLYHLVNNPANLPSLAAVSEFTTHIGIPLPQARIAALPFDKLDVEKGMEVKSPEGQTRWLKNPWSVLAYQLAGDKGLEILHPNNQAEERDSAPAENLLSELLKIPASQGLSTLILIDELLMYAREKVSLDERWRIKLTNFFQYLLQAVSKADKCAMVVSLLASDPTKNDSFGRELTLEIANIFQRQQEEKVQPVGKDDVAEVLRRRLFKPQSIQDTSGFKAQVVAALKGITILDEQTNKEKVLAEQRFLQSYPFHLDLTEILYSKWTGLENFRRTRGVLRTFSLALREAEKWDNCPLIAANIFLGDSQQTNLSEGARELTSIATTEEYEGKQQNWSSIIEGELRKAREIQAESGGIKYREIEQAVFATFLHSQPIGQKALTRELLVLLGHTNPDKIELEKALLRWVNVSWFLDEEMQQDGDLSKNSLPKFWRLGSKPNLKQMHDDACKHRVSQSAVETNLVEEIKKVKSLTAGAKAAGAVVHFLPEYPTDIKDDGEFHYAVLKPEAASTMGNPSAYATKFIDLDQNAPRAKNRNAIVLAVGDRTGLEVAKNHIREYLGWLEVQEQLKKQEIDANRKYLLDGYLKEAKNKIPESIKQAYCLGVTVSEKNLIIAFKVQVDSESLFNSLKAESSKSRIQETPITAEAILPRGAYDLWREDEPSRRFQDLVGAFAQRTNLPKMLKTESIRDTLINGCQEGIFVLRYQRGDRSWKTFWRGRPDEIALKEASLEAILPQHAQLSDIEPHLLLPNTLPQLWLTEQLSVEKVYEYFSGKHSVEIPHEGYTEALAIPRVEEDILKQALTALLKSNQLSLVGEEIDPEALQTHSILQLPPKTSSTATPSTLSPKPSLVRETTSAVEYKVENPPPILSTSAELKIHQIQELGEKIADLKNAAAGTNLSVQVTVQLGGEARPSVEVIEKVNQILQEISEQLKLNQP